MAENEQIVKDREETSELLRRRKRNRGRIGRGFRQRSART